MHARARRVQRIVIWRWYFAIRSWTMGGVVTSAITWDVSASTRHLKTRCAKFAVGLVVY